MGQRCNGRIIIQVRRCETRTRAYPHQHQHIYPSDQPPTPQHNTGKHQSKMRPRGVKKGGDAGKLAEALKELLDVSG